MYSELIDSAYEAQLIRKLDIIPGRKDLTIFGQIVRLLPLPSS